MVEINMINRIKDRKNEILHIYDRGNRKQEICLDRRDYVFLYNLFVYHFRVNKFDLISFCLMPNHYHILSSMRGNVDIGVIMQRINSRYTKYFNKKYGFSGHLFQCPYKYKKIMSCDHFRIVSIYIENNLKEYKTKKRYPYLFKDELLTRYYILNYQEERFSKEKPL